MLMAERLEQTDIRLGPAALIAVTFRCKYATACADVTPLTELPVTSVAHLSRRLDIPRTGIASLVVAGHHRYPCVESRNISISD
jgi:hypothetical protein